MSKTNRENHRSSIIMIIIIIMIVMILYYQCGDEVAVDAADGGVEVEVLPPSHVGLNRVELRAVSDALPHFAQLGEDAVVLTPTPPAQPMTVV
jgi:hypothetical protein